MNLTREELDLLDRRLKGELSHEESVQLAEKLSADERFRSAVKEYETLMKEFESFKTRSDLKTILNEADAEQHAWSRGSDEGTRIVPLKKRIWLFPAIAASFAIVGVASVFLITHSWNQEQSDKYRELRRNVEQIKKSQSLIIKDIEKAKISTIKESFAGSGFLISPGFISTSYHVIKEADSLYVENGKFGSKKATIIYTNPETDIAILRISTKERPPYAIASKEALLAEEVFTLGYPREDVVFGSGTISANSGYRGNPNAYQISVPVNPGNSGGPLFNNKGDVIGIISGKQMEVAGAAFAIKSTKLLEVLSTLAPDSVRAPLMNFRKITLPVSSRVAQVNQWRDYVFVVRVFKN